MKNQSAEALRLAPAAGSGPITVERPAADRFGNGWGRMAAAMLSARNDLRGLVPTLNELLRQAAGDPVKTALLQRVYGVVVGHSDALRLALKHRDARHQTAAAPDSQPPWAATGRATKA